jgi:transposase
MPRQRREFTDEFKAEVVALCKAGDRSKAQIARDLDLNPNLIQKWIRNAEAAGTGGDVRLNDSERDELARLRKENARLRMEREILKKAAAFFAKENG